MRTAFIQTLCEEAKHDDRIWLLTGDLGYSVLESFANRFPDRYLNVGVAEQNMAGLAAGLALTGKIVFIYSIANFPIMRCLEQIRNDICYHNINVNIVSVGGGLEYGTAGYTHYAIEDLAVMRSMPNMTVVSPGDPIETSLAIKAIIKQQGPCYLRLGKAGEPIVYNTQPNFEIGKPIKIKGGKDVTLLSTGGMLKETIDASELLEKDGISAGVLSMHTVKPINSKFVLESLNTKLTVVIEEHSSIGGLGSAIADILVKTNGNYPQLLAINIGSALPEKVGSQIWLRNKYGLDAQSIYQRVREKINGQ